MGGGSISGYQLRWAATGWGSPCAVARHPTVTMTLPRTSANITMNIPSADFLKIQYKMRVFLMVVAKREGWSPSSNSDLHLRNELPNLLRRATDG